ncbi:glycerol-3-phosphate 1-O-acyltransferase PlsY [Apilactobacillus micheneri]|uniref:Glycerol-3-phosphate acyltransferase n=1 Tax=Apilactobacillus micheneri TaxID=1899430 RepID=A0A9Q8IMF8_9LACO|nr:glycerol-3-phosphate 1-O-acyltransferase PlsY [Apilactobacillus micheneri]TPR40660.1 glycerol-3-phosphate 1-O-acyltransferase PlsY [Apilactobacillus micheneri]TPR42127.1 glycerol-3-phosphate 1-O-acyltransferase PlsY [Apilactobacillus micheneri]TPR44949.1 glycerol-3-phosphate 1-O-acyltransferase PlsY [Apilactobacillus micheneri]TPR45081.1 glycerol-3-phosphate 1-O-acyltransferase PlsY [Apilactobacillus micheneri]TPR46423.1 glycerol-3-phosphate 1-O-acyltransferase PlsY [Apilactobacillus michen
MEEKSLKLAILLIIAYLLGSIPSGIWIGKWFFNVDVRKHGSGNIGTTNTYRVLGKKAGTIVMIMDILKGTLATSLPFFFNVNISPIIFGIFAILGHTFSIFDKFKGGKAVATSAGMLLAIHPILFLCACIFEFSFTYITSMVSLASMISFPLIVILLFLDNDPWLGTIGLLLTIFIFIRHRKNIIRIKEGNENLVPFGLIYNHRNK